jgi:hypothetical protein
MRRLMKPLWVLLALVFLFEAWLWDRLAPIVAAVVNVLPWGRVKLWLARTIERLPPWATLIVFVIPFLLLLPLKFLEVWFLAHRNWLGAIAVIVAAKVLGLGVTAFIFDVTRDKLLQMHWFRHLYDWVMWLRDWAHAQVEPIKRRIRKWRRVLRPNTAGRFFRHLARVRRRMQAASSA